MPDLPKTAADGGELRSYPLTHPQGHPAWTKAKAQKEDPCVTGVQGWVKVEGKQEH